MAFDGFTIACLTQELKENIEEGRIVKISQPEKDQLLLTVKKGSEQKRLFISVNPSLPLLYLTSENKTAPLQAPSFCMLLRKYISNGKILSINQPGMERIIEITVEHFNEMGDLCKKTLTIELMGKHSNIILRDDNIIIDSIKHINSFISSVREVLPGRNYFIPFSDKKLNPLENSFSLDESCQNDSIKSFIITKYTGFSPIIAEELLCNADVDSEKTIKELSSNDIENIRSSYNELINKTNQKLYAPNIVFEKNEPIFYGPFIFNIFKQQKKEMYSSISNLLIDYYSKKQNYTITRQKTAELRQLTQSLLNKNNKKYDLQLKQIKDTEKRDKYKLYGELITAYGYNVPSNSTSMSVINYYDNSELTIPLDPTISVIDNGKLYYEKYSKLKRTYDALSEIVVKTKNEIDYLEGIMTSLDMVQNEADISEIKREMKDCGYIHAKENSSKKSTKVKDVKSVPLHYVSSDGFDIYVGKNNYQNEYLSLKFANENDWWFHAKNIPGSHVILKSQGNEIPISSFNDAARLAAHFSSAKNADKIEVDYTKQKYLKKPANSAPGYVIYHKNYSIIVSTDISFIEEK